ncbi:MAG: AsmA family protein, partial [Gammaproteobacteria bacterium]
MRGKKLLMLVFLAALLLVAVLARWAWNADLGRFRPQLETFVSERLGREFRVTELHLDLGRQVAVSARDVRLANPAWADSEQLVTVGSLEATVDLLSLFRPPVMVEQLRLADVEIRAEHSDEHGDSWFFPKLAEGSGSAKSAAGVPLRIGVMQLDAIALHLERPGGLAPLELRIETATQERASGDMLELRIIGSLNDEPVEYFGTLGPRQAIREGRDVHFDGEGRLGPLRIDGTALVDDLATPRHPSLDLTLSAPDIAEVATMLRLPVPPSAPLTLEARARPEGERLALTLHAAAGEARLDLRGHSAGLLDLSRLDYDLQASGPNLGALTKFLQLGAWPEQPFAASGGVMRDGRVLALESVDIEVGNAAFTLDARLNEFPDFANARADFDLRGDDAAAFRELVGIQGIAVGSFEARGSLQAQDGVQERLTLFLRTDIGEATVEGTLGPGPRHAGSVFDVRLEGGNAQRVFDGYGVPGFLPEPFSADVRFTIRENGLDFERAAIATLGADRLEIEGFVSFTPLEAGTRVQLRAEGDDLSQFVFLSGMDLPLAARPYAIESGLSVTPEGFRIEGLTGQIDGNEVQVDGLVSRKDGLAGTDLAFAISGGNLASLLTDTPSWEVPEESYSASGQLRLFPSSMSLDELDLAIGRLKGTARADLPIPFDGTEFRFDGEVSGPNVNVLMPEVEGLALAANPFVLDLDVAVDDGAWRFNDAQLRLGEASLRIDGRARLAPEVSASELSVQLQVPNLADIGSWRGFPKADFP